MSDPIDLLRKEALALPPELRARLIAELLASMDDGPDVEDAGWMSLMRMRADRAIAGESKGIPLPEVRERALKALKKK